MPRSVGPSPEWPRYSMRRRSRAARRILFACPIPARTSTRERRRFGRAPGLTSTGAEEPLTRPILTAALEIEVLAKVRVSDETIQQVRREGQQACKEAAERIASRLEPLIWQEAMRRANRADP